MYVYKYQRIFTCNVLNSTKVSVRLVFFRNSRKISHFYPIADVVAATLISKLIYKFKLKTFFFKSALELKVYIYISVQIYQQLEVNNTYLLLTVHSISAKISKKKFDNNVFQWKLGFFPINRQKYVKYISLSFHQQKPAHKVKKIIK